MLPNYLEPYSCQDVILLLISYNLSLLLIHLLFSLYLISYNDLSFLISSPLIPINLMYIIIIISSIILLFFIQINFILPNHPMSHHPIHSLTFSSIFLINHQPLYYNLYLNSFITISMHFHNLYYYIIIILSNSNLHKLINSYFFNIKFIIL